MPHIRKSVASSGTSGMAVASTSSSSNSSASNWAVATPLLFTDWLNRLEELVVGWVGATGADCVPPLQQHPTLPWRSRWQYGVGEKSWTRSHVHPPTCPPFSKGWHCSGGQSPGRRQQGAVLGAVFGGELGSVFWDFLFHLKQNERKCEVQNCFSSDGRGGRQEAQAPFASTRKTHAWAVLLRGSLRSPRSNVHRHLPKLFQENQPGLLLYWTLIYLRHYVIRKPRLLWDPCLLLRPAWIPRSNLFATRRDVKLPTHPPTVTLSRLLVKTPVTKAYDFQLVALFHLSFYNEWF